MAKTKKSPGGIFFNQNSLSVLDIKKIKECEWCIQFDDDEPNIFATGSDQLGEAKISFTLTNRSDCNIVFYDDKTKKRLKIFTREKTI